MKKLLTFSGLMTTVLLIWNFVGNYKMCDLFSQGASGGSCPFIMTSIAFNLLPIAPLFLVSLLTYKMSDAVNRAWMRFAMVWIPLSMAAIFVSPQYSTDWMFPVTKSTVAFYSSAVFLIVSVIIVLVVRSRGVMVVVE